MGRSALACVSLRQVLSPCDPGGSENRLRAPGPRGATIASRPQVVQERASHPHMLSATKQPLSSLTYGRNRDVIRV